MLKTQKTTFLVLAVLCLIYFLAFIPANRTGAKDPVMISIFEPDEFAQFSIPRDMLTPQDTVKHTLFNFIAYDHYYYGYPFYLSSIAAILPVYLSVGWANKYTQLLILLLRQFVSVLPMLASVGLMVFSVTRFRKILVSLALALFILTVPAVVENNLWWHPDSLVVFFIVATLASLREDRFRLSKFFWLAAMACGLAVGTKVLGLFFFLTIPLYLFLGIRQGAYSVRRMLFSALGFVLVMATVIIISNPYLLIPSEFNQLVQIMTRQATAQSSGWTLAYSRGIASWLQIITHLYGSIPFWITVILWIFIAIRQNSTRTWGLLILSWIIPLSIYILFFTAIKPTHFLLPVAIPALAFLVIPFLQADLNEKSKSTSWVLIRVVTAAVLLVQFGQNLLTDVNIYKSKLLREQANPIIQFYDQFSTQYLSNLDGMDDIKVLRDVRTYFPASGNIKVSEFYNTLTQEQLDKKHPDLLILWKQRILDYSSAESTEKAIDPSAYREVQLFFASAKNQDIPGYQLLMENDEIIAFISLTFTNEHPNFKTK